MKLLAAYTDEELLAGCIKNDARCQQRLYERHYGKMLSLCCRYCNNKEDAEELLNAGFLKVFQNVKSFKAQGSFEGWIRRIILNTILEAHRSNVRYKEVITYPEKDHDVEIDNGIIGQLYAEDIIRMIGRLPASSRMVFNLFAIEGYSHQEIAEMLKISVGTSKWHVYFAKDKLKNMINDLQIKEAEYVNAK